MKVEGQCHCGNVAYQADVDPDRVAICHCTDCQMLSGSAFRVVTYVPEENFRLLKGTPKGYSKVAASGRRRLQLFCPDCGTSICSISEEDGPKNYSLRVGTMRERALLKPSLQYWHRSHLPWVGSLDSIPQKDTE